MKSEDYKKLRDDLKKTVDAYFRKEDKGRERMLHNIFMLVSSIAMEDDNGISIPEVYGSLGLCQAEIAFLYFGGGEEFDEQDMPPEGPEFPPPEGM